MQCGRVGSRPLSEPRVSMAMRRGNPLFRPTPRDPPPAPPSEGRGVKCPRQEPRRPSKGGCPTAGEGRGLRPIAGAVPCAGPKTMFDRFPIPCLHPHVGRTPIMHYALCIMHWKDNVRPLLQSPACTRIYGECQLCIMHLMWEFGDGFSCVQYRKYIIFWWVGIYFLTLHTVRLMFGSRLAAEALPDFFSRS